MSSFRICVPTYKRKYFSCTRLLEDNDVVLHLYVRKSEYESKMYDTYEFVYGKQIVFHLIRDDVKDIGETRQEILKSCIEDDIDYCVMLDDSVSKIEDMSSYKSVNEVILDAIRLMKTDKHRDDVADFAFVKYASTDNNVTVVLDRDYAEGQDYFTTFPCQCHVIDVNKVKDAGICYHQLDECGFEDAAFLGDMIKAGLVVIGRKDYVFVADFANKPKHGGNHVGQDVKALQDRYDKYNKLCLDYLKLDGTSIEKRYRSYVGCTLSLIKWDYDFYREVLVEKRDLNAEVIANKLSTYN